MEYSKIVSVTGLPGLFELLSTKSDGAIVRSLSDKTTRFAATRSHNFSHLESIEIFTVKDNVNLVEVFKAMESATERLPDAKDSAAVKKYFEKVYPDIDFERVYASDMKKMIIWLGILKENNIEMKLSEPEVEQPAIEEEKDDKPAKKVAKKVEEKKDEGKKAEIKEEKKAEAKKVSAPKQEESAKKPATKKKAAGDTKAPKEASGKKKTEEKPKKTAKKSAKKK